jgi:hypothetical protein
MTLAFARLAALKTGIIALLFPLGSPAADVFQVSPDISISIGTNPQTVSDQDVMLDGAAISLASLGLLPAAADLSAFHVLPQGDRLFALDSATRLPGGLVAESRDVIRYNGSSYSLYFDGSAAGVPSGAAVDALSIDQTGAILLSFDIGVSVGRVTAADEDLLRYSNNTFMLYFDGSSVGVANALDLDAVHFLPGSNQLLLSFDTTGQVAGALFDDDDVLHYNPVNSSWNGVYRGASKHVAFEAADLDALYIAQFTSGLFKDGFETLP